MQILEIYAKCLIPPNLQRHQIQVAAVGQYIIEHWQGPRLNKKSLIEGLLLHDMGNIVKFKRPFLGEMSDREEYWAHVQQDFIDKYGKNAHVATEAVLKELGVRDETFDIVKQMGVAADGTLLAFRWEAKIADYADTCVTPEGIVGFEPRVKDLVKRYSVPEDGLKVRSWRKNALEVQEYVDVDLATLVKEDFSRAMEMLKKTSITL